MPVDNRDTSVCEDGELIPSSCIILPPEADEIDDLMGWFATVASVEIVPHAWQLGHCPCHLACEAPQAEQIYSSLTLDSFLTMLVIGCLEKA